MLKDLSKLRGVGPATATLLLSVYKPNIIPFLSDELWRWVCWDDMAGWQKKIRYTLIEWHELCLAVADLGERLTASASEVEKVAYVIGRFATTKGLEKEVRDIEKEAKAVEEPTREEIAIEDRIAAAIENSELNEAKEKGSKGLQSIRNTFADRKKANDAKGEKATAEDKEETQGSSKAASTTKEISRTRSNTSAKDESGTRKRRPTNTSNPNFNDSVVDVEPVAKRTKRR